MCTDRLGGGVSGWECVYGRYCSDVWYSAGSVGASGPVSWWTQCRMQRTHTGVCGGSCDYEHVTPHTILKWELVYQPHCVVGGVTRALDSVPPTLSVGVVN